MKPGVSGYETFAKVGQFLATATIEQIDTMAIFGDPQRCTERVRQYGAVGVNHIMVMFDWGGMPQKTVFRSMELFAKHVMPNFRGVQSGQTATIQEDRHETRAVS